MNFNNGVSVASLQELSDVMPNITGPTFRHHVTKERNDIADWVRDKIGDAELSEKLRGCKNTEEFVKVLEEDKKTNNKPFTPVFGGSAAATTPVAESRSDTSASDKPADDKSSSESQPVTPQINPDTGEGESIAWNDIKLKMKSLNNDEQIKLLERSIKKYPQDINIKFPLALLYHKRKDYASAEKIYKEILELYPKNAKAMFYLGGLMKTQKKYDDALKYLNLYMDLKKSDPKVKELIKKLEEKNKAT